MKWHSEFLSVARYLDFSVGQGVCVFFSPCEQAWRLQTLEAADGSCGFCSMNCPISIQLKKL